MARKGRARPLTRKGRPRTWSKVHKCGSLLDLQALLTAHGAKKRRGVRIIELTSIRDATVVGNLLRHQEEVKEWDVMGTRHLQALADVDDLIGTSAALLGQAIRHMKMEVGAAAAIPTNGHAEPLVPANRPALEDTAALELAGRMLKVGTGLSGEPIVPYATLFNLAARVLDDEGPYGDLDLTTTVEGDEGPGAHMTTTAIGFRAEGLASATGPSIREPAARVLADDDHATPIQVAQRTVQAGTGRREQPHAPAQVVPGDSPSRHDVANFFDSLLRSGTALRHHRLRTPSIQRPVQGLGAQIKDLGMAVLTSRHPPAMLLQFLYTVQASLNKLWDSGVSPRQFKRLRVSAESRIEFSGIQIPMQS
ncbi:hypothetical protein SEVIR_1G041725v4 [Setaria viridis]